MSKAKQSKIANRPMHLTTMPSALLARRLRSSLWCQKQVVASDRGRSRKYMPPARAHFESHAPRQGIWREAMTIRTTEAKQQEYPEAEITATAKPDRRDPCHSKNIPEARLEMISRFPIPALATRRPEMRYSRKMNSTLQRPAQAQASFHALPDHEGKYANRAVQLIAGRCNFRAEATVIRRSGTGDAGRRASRVPSLPMRAINHFRQPAIPDGGRSPEIYASGDSSY